MLLVVFSVEQGKGIVSGLRIAERISDFILSPEVFFPLLILIFLYAIAYFSLKISSGEAGLMSVVLYIFLASVIFFLIAKKGSVEIEYVLIGEKKGGMYATEVSEGEGTRVDYAGTLPPTSSQKATYPNAPYIVDMLSFFDPILKGIVLAVDTIDAWDMRTIDRSACLDPEKIFAYAITSPFYLTTDYMRRTGKANGFVLKTMEGFIDELEKTVADAKKTGKGVGQEVWDRISGVGIIESIGAWEELLLSLGIARGSLYWWSVKANMEERIKECKEKFPNLDEEAMMSAVKEYAVKYGGQPISSIVAAMKPHVGNITKEMENAGTFDLRVIGGWIQSGVKTLASFIDRNFKFGFKTKFTTLKEAQGVVLGMLIGLLPLVATLSLIPAGGLINYKLLIGYFLAYFLVSLWVPVLYLVYIIVWGKAALSAVGGFIQ